MPTESKTLTVLEAAMELGVSMNHIYTLCKERKLEARKEGRTWAILASSVAARRRRLLHV